MHQVLLLEAIDGEVALAHSHDQELLLLASDAHRVQWVGRFVRVRDALEQFVPDFEGLVLTGCEELAFVNICEASDARLVGAVTPEVFLDAVSAIRHIGVDCILFLCSGAAALASYFSRFHSF